MASSHHLAAADEAFPRDILATPHDHLTALPTELEFYVIDDLSIGDLGRLAQTCRSFKELITPIMYRRDNNEKHPRAIFWAASADPVEDDADKTVDTVLDLALAHGGNLNKTYGSTGPQHFRATPLHLAAARGNLRVVQKLLKNGAKPNARGREFLYNPELSLDHEEFDERMETMDQTVVMASRYSSWRPLFVPFVVGHEKIITALLENGASPILAIADRRSFPGARSNITVLHILASQNVSNFEHPTTSESYFKKYSDLINVPVPRGEIPLNIAMRHGNSKLIREIIINGGDVEAVSELGITPLIQAIKCFTRGKTAEKRKRYSKIIESLVQDGNARVGTPSGTTVVKTPLAHIAQAITNDFQHISWRFAVKEISSIIYLLLDHGADVNERSEEGGSLLVALAWVIGQRKKRKKNQMDSSKLLDLFSTLVTKRKADINARFTSGASILGACILKFGREPLPFFQTLIKLNAKLRHDEINPIFRMWVTDLSLRNPKLAFNMLEYSKDITQESIDFAYTQCFESKGNLLDRLQSYLPHSTVPQTIAAEALIQDNDLERFHHALKFKNLAGDYIDANGDGFLHLIVKRLQISSEYKVTQAVSDAKKVLRLGASVNSKDADNKTALDRLLSMRMHGNEDHDRLIITLQYIKCGERFLWKERKAKNISAGEYKRKYAELIEWRYKP